MATYRSILPALTPGWLLEATDRDGVRRAIEAVEPAIGPGGALTIDKCSVRLRVLETEGFWRGSVTLRLRQSGEGAPARDEVSLAASFRPPDLREDGETSVTGTFGDEGWTCSIPRLGLALTAVADDPELPSRGLLLDADRCRPLLEQSIRTARPAWSRATLASCQPEVTRYKAGSRCTVRYRVEYVTGAADDGDLNEHPPALVVAKTYRAGAGTRTFGAMKALWESPLGASSIVRLAEPLAYHSDPGVLVQGPVSYDATLKTVIGEVLSRGGSTVPEGFRRLLSSTAAGLAELHSSGVRDGPVRSWEDELREAVDCLSRLRRAIPAFEGLGRPQLDDAVATFCDRPLARAVPSHGGFRPAQVLVEGDQIGFIDFDDFCQADPAMDLAEFVRFLVQEGFGEPEDVDGDEARRRLCLLDELVELVVGTYLSTGELDRDRLVAWQTLGWLNRILGGWAKGKTDRLVIDACLFDHFLALHSLPSEPFDRAAGLK